MGLHFVLFLLQFLIILVYVAEAKKLSRPFNNSISSIFAFGDSMVDPGNNNFITTAFKSNFPPYGVSFPDRVPTGRFSDGRLISDLIASYIGIKENVPPYLDPNLKLEDLKTGVSFASAGSGLDPLTADLLGVIPIKKQVEYFKEYKMKLETAIGKERTERVISNAAFLMSAGVNDIAISYYFTSHRLKEYNITGYQQFLLGSLKEIIQALREEGARMIAVVAQPPISCVPIVIKMTFNKRHCNETLSSVGFDYNEKLQKVLTDMDEPNSKIIYADIYDPVLKMVKRPSKYGFKKVNVGCCGSGLAEISFMCNSQSHVCRNPKKYMFFDSAHATEATYISSRLCVRLSMRLSRNFPINP